MTIPRPTEDIIADMRELARVNARPQPLSRVEIALLVGSAAGALAVCVAVAMPRLFAIEAGFKAAAGV